MTRETLADLAAFIAARGIEIQPCNVRWLPACSFCGAELQRHDTYEILADDLIMLCGRCADRLATIAIHRLPHDDAPATPGG